MTSQEAQDYGLYLSKILESYEEYRACQEQEHAHLARRGAIAEWNNIVRRKKQAYQNAQMLDSKTQYYKERWKALGQARSKAEFAFVREKLSQLQNLLTRILTCDRMNETLLYHGGYLQAVVAYRGSKEEGASLPA